MENAEPSFDAFTSHSYAVDGSKAIVTTRVPVNMFDFEAVDASIEVSGALTLKLADGTRRRLSAGQLVRALQAAPADTGNEADFDLNIELQPEMDSGVEDLEGEGAAMMNSSKAIAGKGVAVFGMILASAYALW